MAPDATGPHAKLTGPQARFAAPHATFTGARVLVAGLGVTGRAAATALRASGAAVTTVDESSPDADARPGEAGLAGVELVVVSPGWPPTHDLLVAAARAGIPVWSEVELAWKLRATRPGGHAPWLAVTGTNGKTSTVEMLASILTAAGLRTLAVGNVGTPVVEAAQDPALDVLAVELSSFQLHFTHSMTVQAGAVLNIAADHLDWHGGIEAYAADKGKIYTGAQVACVYNVADPVTEDLVRQADVAEGARAVGFTLGAPGPGQVGLIDGILVDRVFHAPFDAQDRHTHAAELATLADLEHLAGPGGLPPHVVANALAAATLARAHGVPAAAVRDGLRAFTPGAHRIQTVATVGHVAYIDDSKATNAHAASASLAAFDAGKVVWIAGGLAKGATFDDLVAERADRLRAVVVIGVDPQPFVTALTRHAPNIPVTVIDPGDTGTVMLRAVDTARTLAQPGDTVLLAPAAASMDQFHSYAERGDAFTAAARGLLG